MTQPLSSSPPVDLTNIVAALGDNLPVLEKLIDYLITNSRLQLEQLRSSIDENNFRTVERAAHTLKGSFANFGVQREVQLSSQLERAANAENLDGAPMLFEELQQGILAILAYFDSDRWKKDWL